MADVIRMPHPPCEFVCEDCGGNQWQMWIMDSPRQMTLECHDCGAVYTMPIED